MMKKDKSTAGPRSATATDHAVGHNIRQLRLLAALSQQEVAAALGVTFQQVQKYENGSNRLPVAMLLKLKTLYGIPYDRFFTGAAPAADDATAPSIPLADCDDQTIRLCRRLAAIGDQDLKAKIGRIIEVLAAP